MLLAGLAAGLQFCRSGGGSLVWTRAAGFRLPTPWRISSLRRNGKHCAWRISADAWYARELKTNVDSIRRYEQATYYAGHWRDEYEIWVQMLAGSNQDLAVRTLLIYRRQGQHRHRQGLCASGGSRHLG
jgi:hypothetical protein